MAKHILQSIAQPVKPKSAGTLDPSQGKRPWTDYLAPAPALQTFHPTGSEPRSGEHAAKPPAAHSAANAPKAHPSPAEGGDCGEAANIICLCKLPRHDILSPSRLEEIGQNILNAFRVKIEWTMGDEGEPKEKTEGKSEKKRNSHYFFNWQGARKELARIDICEKLGNTIRHEDCDAKIVTVFHCNSRFHSVCASRIRRASIEKYLTVFDKPGAIGGGTFTGGPRCTLADAPAVIENLFRGHQLLRERKKPDEYLTKNERERWARASKKIRELRKELKERRERLFQKKIRDVSSWSSLGHPVVEQLWEKIKRCRNRKLKARISSIRSKAFPYVWPHKPGVLVLEIKYDSLPDQLKALHARILKQKLKVFKSLHGYKMPESEEKQLKQDIGCNYGESIRQEIKDLRAAGVSLSTGRCYHIHLHFLCYWKYTNLAAIQKVWKQLTGGVNWHVDIMREVKGYDGCGNPEYGEHIHKIKNPERRLKAIQECLKYAIKGQIPKTHKVVLMALLHNRQMVHAIGGAKVDKEAAKSTPLCPRCAAPFTGIGRQANYRYDKKRKKKVTSYTGWVLVSGQVNTDALREEIIEGGQHADFYEGFIYDEKDARPVGTFARGCGKVQRE